MIRMVSLLVLALLFCSCSPARQAQDKEVVAKINNYSMTSEDFENEVKGLSSYEREGKTKQELLDEVIQRKLLLLEAQREGLDREGPFMKMVEHFWEQSLLRAIVEKRMGEFLAAADVTDEETRREQVNKFFVEWLDDLKKNSNISVNKKALEKISVPVEE